MYSYTGGLYGKIKSNQVLTIQVNMDAGTLKFWVDGKPHGPLALLFYFFIMLMDRYIGMRHINKIETSTEQQNQAAVCCVGML